MDTDLTIGFMIFFPVEGEIGIGLLWDGEGDGDGDG